MLNVNEIFIPKVLDQRRTNTKRTYHPLDIYMQQVRIKLSKTENFIHIWKQKGITKRNNFTILKLSIQF